MLRLLGCLLIGVLTLATVAAPDVLAQKKKIEVKMKWSGSVENEKAMKPNAITNAKDLEAIWKEWKVAGDVPKVDFTKDIVVSTYSVGSRLNLAGANLDDKGDLQVLGFGTRDIGPGFRYVLATVSKEGVKTVNGKELPK
jgi:hypothetical protein